MKGPGGLFTVAGIQYGYNLGGCCLLKKTHQSAPSIRLAALESIKVKLPLATSFEADIRY